jgi:hypothetical protein
MGHDTDPILIRIRRRFPGNINRDVYNYICTCIDCKGISIHIRRTNKETFVGTDLSILQNWSPHMEYLKLNATRYTDSKALCICINTRVVTIICRNRLEVMCLRIYVCMHE